MKPGDLIAFQGKGFISSIIRLRTWCRITHVGGVHKITHALSSWARVDVIESTSLYGKAGVQLNHLSKHLDEYPGSMWWYPLSREARAWFDEEAYLAFCEETMGRPYDYRGALGSAVDWWDRLCLNPRNLEALFCSEHYAAALQIAGVLDTRRNASEMTPKDIIKLPFFTCPTRIK
jgi:hypothetical protein